MTAPITVRFWAGARRAAGCDQDTVDVRTVGELRGELARRPALHDLMRVAAILVDGRAATDATMLTPGATADVLPPFAGG